MMNWLFGAKSKYNKSLPFAFGAKIDTLNNCTDTPVYDYYYSDTVCGIVEYLNKNKFKPDDAEIYEIYRNKESPIQIEHCVDKNGNWLVRPELCASMQKHYIGHIDENSCSYNDRSREVDEPLGA